MIDVDHQINSVARMVGERTLDAGQARVVTISRVYPTSVEDLWDACTDADRIPRWFAPVTGDLRLGGRYQVEGNAGGEVTRCDPPHGFDATWEFGDEVSWIELSITAVDSDSARFTLQHIAHVDDARWTEYGPGAVGVGWELSTLGLALYTERSISMEPAEAAAWSESDEGKLFVTASSEGWYEAAVAGGAVPADARAAADRTTTFYTGG